MKYRCPVCMFSGLPYPPRDYHICPCCGTEFGNDDAEFTHEQLREMWFASGARWFFGREPANWNWVTEFYKAGRIGVIVTGVEQEIDFQRFQPSSFRPDVGLGYSYRVA